MAKIGDGEAASRYDGISAGPRFDYTFETQAGIPVDGGDQLNRDLSPFTLRLIPPDALINAAAVDAQENVNLITAAALGASQSTRANEVRTALSQVSAVSADATTLESFVASGRFLSDQGSDYAVTLSDAYMAADIALQLQRILDAPPLTLLVNPNNMTINYTNVQSYVSKTRWGYIFERWGEEQPSISFSGSTGAFIAGLAEAPGTSPTISQLSGETTSVSGVQFASKRDSAAWQNLMALLQFYKSNGYIYDTVLGSEAHLFIGAIAIDYDQWTYVGHIESFDYTYASEKPHNMDWEMDFKVDRMYDNSQPTPVVLPQKPPTESAGTFASSGSPSTFGDAVSAISSSFNRAKDPNSEFGSVPFELLTP